MSPIVRRGPQLNRLRQSMQTEAEVFYEEGEGDFDLPIFAPRKEYLPSQAYRGPID